jgi:hypothetical protein
MFASRFATHLCDTPPERWSRLARDTGVDGPLVVECDSGIYPQQHSAVAECVCSGASSLGGRVIGQTLAGLADVGRIRTDALWRRSQDNMFNF